MKSSVKRQVIKAAKTIPKLIPKVKPELKAAYKDLKRLGQATIEFKSDPKRIKQIEKKFRTTLIKHHKRLTRMVEGEEPSLSKKSVTSIAALIVTIIIQAVIVSIVSRYTDDERIISLATFVFAGPVTEEFFRMYLQEKYQAGLVYSALISVVELPHQIKYIITMTDPGLYSRVRFTGQGWVAETTEKIIKQARSARWKSILMTLIGKGGHFVYHYIQKFLLKRAKEKDKPGLKVIAYIITVVMHSLWNLLGGFAVSKQYGKLAKVAKEELGIEDEELESEE